MKKGRNTIRCFWYGGKGKLGSYKNADGPNESVRRERKKKKGDNEGLKEGREREQYINREGESRREKEKLRVKRILTVSNPI